MKNSYQFSDEESLENLRTDIKVLSDAVDKTPQNNFKNIIKYTLSVALVVILGVVTYTSYSGERSLSKLLSKKVVIGADSVRPLNEVMAKDGSLKFAALSDTEISNLFAEFKTTFGRKVEKIKHFY